MRDRSTCTSCAVWKGKGVTHTPHPNICIQSFPQPRTPSHLLHLGWQRLEHVLLQPAQQVRSQHMVKLGHLSIQGHGKPASARLREVTNLLTFRHLLLSFCPPVNPTAP